MAFRFIMIGGTGAPPQSEVYYSSIMHVANRYVDQSDFVTLDKLGFGEEHDAAQKIDEEYIEATDDRFILAGHSQGGHVASLIAKKYPEKVLAVITLATPFKGTTWADPVNMPIRGLVEAVTKVSRGRLRLKPALRQFIFPLLPIVRDLAVHSEVSEEVLEFLANQLGGHETHAFIGTGDWWVFPHRSANPIGPMVSNYIVCLDDEYERLKPILPESLMHISAHTGHTMIIRCKPVLDKIDEIIAHHAQVLAQH